MSNMTPNSNVSYCPLIEMMRNFSSKSNEVNWVVVSLHGLVSCLGILENALIIWVLGFRLRQHTVISIWVLNLSLSDFLACLTLPLFTAYLSLSKSWELSDFLCTAQSSIFYVNMFVSAFLLTVISLDRLLLVVKPVWSKNHRSVAGAWKVCALGWLWAVINTAPYSVFRSVIERHDGKKLCYHNFALYLSVNESLETVCAVREQATAISKMLFAFLFPLVIITASYIKIALRLNDLVRRRKQNDKRMNDILTRGGSSEVNNIPLKTTDNNFSPKSFTADSSTKAKSNATSSSTSAPSLLPKSFTKMTALVIIAFTLFWAPYHILCMMEVAFYQKEIADTRLPLAATFSFLNPVLNPVLYAFSCPQFCLKIRQNLTAVFEGLIEEGGLLMVPGSFKPQKSQDVDFKL
ncbi:prostaglandin D2 receptor 2 [Austrofundulus limnaeus]|uniref:Prostaglandin D2 receptor 2-like n=1 Tax=Austrofundulus limnaeus TaxID=52670 RepID=A0A2I4BD77_AUSLI|nr:PREDICTED: prostaglandin D2 receptor 2-like [Austrofundulus limnaeus]XP_013865697.1 PREDICTED: prostaglandin D2 receptor 2-like [Austrofundulus limnaeus]